MIKQRITLTEMPEVEWNRYMKSHNSANIHGENLHIWAVVRKKSFLENQNIFSQKNYTTIMRTYWATKFESRDENEYWATCHNISDLFDGRRHPLLIWSVFLHWSGSLDLGINTKLSWQFPFLFSFLLTHYYYGIESEGIHQQ